MNKLIIQLINKLDNSGVNVLMIDLFKIAIEILEKRNVLEDPFH